MKKTEWIKSPQEISGIRASGHELARIMQALIALVQPGVTAAAIDTAAEALMRKVGATPIFKGYGREWGKPFPASICFSRNAEVVHGIPLESVVIRLGDVVKLDIGMRYQGFVTDMARTVVVGTPTDLQARLIAATEEAFHAGLATIRPDSRMEDYARAAEAVVAEAGFHTVQDLVGHGVGRELHEKPDIPNYSRSGLPNFRFAAGMVVALEPMVNVGTHEVDLAADQWTFVSADGSLSAHYENTILVTETGTEVLTATE
jgi:methionyl aminopeptidase